MPSVVVSGRWILPNKAEGSCAVLGERSFGELVKPPEPFGFEIHPDTWKPWAS
ncbi:hypothetical protein ACGFZP_22975 [Kitasatospora sp. NPDC048239]|uniref:hypothetical protein n=1 Tax=Kitasatospora sp. NPDC048239 TaxID=3364046 RepID=UPI003721A62D